MKIFILLILFPFNLLSQNDSLNCNPSVSNSKISTYVKYIDSLRENNKLDKYFYKNMSRCSGGLYGFLYNSELVYMSSRYGGEFGYSEKEVYLKGTKIYKIRYREHYGKQKEFFDKYGDEEEPDYSKMKYTDTLYTFVMYKSPKMYKTSGSKFIKESLNHELLSSLISCAQRMREELLSDEIEKRDNK